MIRARERKGEGLVIVFRLGGVGLYLGVRSNEAHWEKGRKEDSRDDDGCYWLNVEKACIRDR